MAIITFEYSKEESPHGQVHGQVKQVEVPGLDRIDYGTLREVESAFLRWFHIEHVTQALIEWKAKTEAEGLLSHYRALLPYGTPKFPPTPASTFFDQHSQKRPDVEPFVPTSQQAAGALLTEQEKLMLSDYQALMNEVKYRLKLVLQLLREDAPYPPGIMKELCFLQIRMVCELIGLGCLLAHGDMKGTQTRQLKKAYSPEKIISELDKLHPNFFPSAFKPRVKEDGRILVVELESGFLTKSELVKLHGLCGQVVHRGNIERFRAGEPAPLTNRKETIEWTQKLLWLVDHHIIYLTGMDKAIACAVRVMSDTPVTTTFLSGRQPSPK